jgi:hypothetical protein
VYDNPVYHSLILARLRHASSRVMHSDFIKIKNQPPHWVG